MLPRVLRGMVAGTANLGIVCQNIEWRILHNALCWYVVIWCRIFNDEIWL